MRFPRYTRKEDRRCKLTEAEIVEIRKLRSFGISCRELAGEFDIGLSAIYYWCMLDEDRKERHKRAYRNQLFKKPWGKLNQKEYRKRKLQLHPELYNYENEYYKKRFKSIIQPRNKEYWLKHKDKKTKSNKTYQLTHLDKFREYNKKSYWKIKQLRKTVNNKFRSKL